MTHDLFSTRKSFETGSGSKGTYYSLPQLERSGLGNISRLPISIRIVLESVLRNYDGGTKVSEANIRALSSWRANAERTEEIPFVVARVILQDFTGVPLLVDLAAVRSAVERMGKDAGVIEPIQLSYGQPCALPTWSDAGAACRRQRRAALPATRRDPTP